MNYSNFIFILLISTFLISCNSERRQNSGKVFYFDSDSFLKSKLLSESDYELSEKVNFPIGVSTKDSLTVVVDAMKEEDFISIFNSKNFELINSFGKIGQGPKEFGEKPSINIVGDSILQLFDWERKRVTGISLTKIISDDSLNLIYEHLLPPELIHGQEAIKIDNGIFVGGYLDDGLLAILDDSTLYTKYIPYINVYENKELNYEEIRWYYSSRFATNNSAERIAFAMQRQNQIIIYNYDGELIKVIRNRSFSPPYNTDRETIPYHYNDITVTDSLIYASYIGKSSEEIEEQLEKGQPPVSEVHVFDWNGKPLYKFNLGNEFVSFLEVDAKSQSLIIINEYEEESIISLYKSELIK